MNPHQIAWLRALRALRALFAIEAACLALILPRIPDIRDALALTPSALGLALLGLPLGALMGFLVAPRVVQRIGSARGAWLSVAAATLAFVPVSLAGTLPLLLAALFVVGLAIAHTEIALNAQARSRHRRGLGAQVLEQAKQAVATVHGGLLTYYVRMPGLETSGKQRGRPNADIPSRPAIPLWPHHVAVARTRCAVRDRALRHSPAGRIRRARSAQPAPRRQGARART